MIVLVVNHIRRVDGMLSLLGHLSHVVFSSFLQRVVAATVNR